MNTSIEGSVPCIDGSTSASSIDMNCLWEKEGERGRRNNKKYQHKQGDGHINQRNPPPTHIHAGESRPKAEVGIRANGQLKLAAGDEAGDVRCCGERGYASPLSRGVRHSGGNKRRIRKL